MEVLFSSDSWGTPLGLALFRSRFILFLFLLRSWNFILGIISCSKGAVLIPGQHEQQVEKQ